MTAIAYEPGDFLGYLLAWCSLIPIFTFVAELTAFVVAESRPRRIQVAFLIVGQLLNEAINLILKNLFQSPRPQTSDRDDYGMPSSHAQFVGFALVALWVSIEMNLKLIPIVQAGLVITGTSVLISSVAQVIVGAIVGVLCGVAWRKFYTKDAFFTSRSKMHHSVNINSNK